MSTEQIKDQRGSGIADPPREFYIDGDTEAEARAKAALDAHNMLETRLRSRLEVRYEDGVGLYLVKAGTEERVTSDDPEILRLIGVATMASLKSE